VKSLAGKVAVVTGGGAGLGRALCIELTKRGAVAVPADINESTAAETAQLLGGIGAPVKPFAVDMTQRDAVFGLADDVAAEHGGIDIWINNAGISARPNAPFLPAVLEDRDAALTATQRLMDVNLVGTVHGTAACLPHLQQKPEAHLVNVASAAGIIGFYGVAPYSAAKFAVRGFTEALQAELRGTNIAVTLVYPGGVRTDIMANSPLITGNVGQATDAKLANLPGVMSAQTAAAIIVKGIRKDRSRILLGAFPKLLSAGARLSPTGARRLLSPAVEKMARTMDPR
jgi:NAD(P)-dependent dehydrogenase (short-subunit alcohol dehydrogenase family)